MKSQKTTALFAALLALLLLQSELNVQASNVFTLQVPDTALWTDTGINVSAGNLLTINASGTVRYGNDLVSVTGPGGTNSDGTVFFSNMPLPTTVVVSMIGKIGGTTAANTGTLLPEGLPGTGPGFVGSNYNFIVPTTGELFLGFNDNFFLDNSGSFSVSVTVSTVPEPSSMMLVAFGILALVFVSRLTQMLKQNRTPSTVATEK